MTIRLLLVCLLALGGTADAVEPAYSFVVYWPSLLGSPFAFRGEGHTDLRHCNRIRAVALERIEQMTGGPGKFTGTVSICTTHPATIIFPNE